MKGLNSISGTTLTEGDSEERYQDACLRFSHLDFGSWTVRTLLEHNLAPRMMPWTNPLKFLASSLEPICSCKSSDKRLSTLNNSISGTFFNFTTFQRLGPSHFCSKPEFFIVHLFSTCSCSTERAESILTVESVSFGTPARPY